MLQENPLNKCAMSGPVNINVSSVQFFVLVLLIYGFIFEVWHCPHIPVQFPTRVIELLSRMCSTCVSLSSSTSCVQAVFLFSSLLDCLVMP